MKHCLVFASLISPSKMILFEKKYQTFDTVFHHQMKHLEVRQKYSAVRRIFNSLLGVSCNISNMRCSVSSPDWPTIYRVGAAVVTTITSEVCVFFKVGVSAKETETQIVAREFEANIVGKYRVESKPTRCAMRWNRTGSVDTTLLQFWLASRESYSVYFSLRRLG